MARHIHRLTARIVPSPYGGENLALLVDDEPLTVLLDRVAPGLDLSGLVPTLLGCDDRADARLVANRVTLRPGDAKVIPILMCPDDSDFGCTTVVVERSPPRRSSSGAGSGSTPRRGERTPSASVR
jgi:hypothetical protein